MLAIFSYGFETANKNFKESNIELHTLSNYEYLLEVALKTNYINQAESELLKSWRKDPANWKK
jgi:orotate phosphoribosyltransferase